MSRASERFNKEIKAEIFSKPVIYAFVRFSILTFSINENVALIYSVTICEQETKLRL